MKINLKIITVLLFLLTPVAVNAQSCTGTAGSINFGINLSQPTTAVNAATTVSLTCSGTPNTILRACLAAPVSGGTLALRRMTNGGQFITYNLYKDAARTQILGIPSAAHTPLTIDVNIGGGGTGAATVAVYGQVTAGQSGKPANTYTDLFSGGNRWDVRTGPVATTNCATYNSTQRRRIATTVSAGIGQLCGVLASPFNFGTWGSLDVARDATGTITALCALGTPYSIALDGGAVGNLSARKMGVAGAAPGVIDYQLYTNIGRTTLWGNGTTGSVVTGTGTGVNQIIPIYGRVPVQTTPAQNVYSDRITVTMTY